MRRVLVTDFVHCELIEGLRNHGFKVVYAPEIESDEVNAWLHLFDGVVINTKTPIRADLIEKNPQLKFIGRVGVGLDIVDMDAAKANGIDVVNTPGANANAVAEHCVGLLLALLRNIPGANAEVKSGYWFREKNRGIELKGKTIGIIGFGNTGRAFATKFAGWETRIVSFDKYKTHYAEDLRFVEETTLDEVLLKSDVISVHVPLTDETWHMVNQDFLRRCKPGLVLINASRGPVVDTEALVNGLEQGQVFGACLDVIESEQPSKRSQAERALYQRLFDMDQVIFSPHIAGWTWASKRNIARQMLRDLKALNVLR